MIRRTLPNNKHIAYQAFPDLADEEVHIRSPHSNTTDGHGNALVPSRYGQEAALR